MKIKIFAIALLNIMLVSCSQHGKSFEKSWTSVNDRVWIGAEFWANRLQDWKIQNNRLECIASLKHLHMRTAHLINCRLGENKGDFFASVDVGTLQANPNADAACGFLIAAGPELDVWGASLVQQKPGPEAGLFAGINISGELFIKDMDKNKVLTSTSSELSETTALVLEANLENASYALTLKCGNTSVSLPNVDKDRLIGNIALVSHPGSGENPGAFWFNHLKIAGSKLDWYDHTSGPIVSTQYTLHKNILKLTAQMVPVSKADPQSVILEIQDDGAWKEISKTKIITPGFTATFKIDGWKSTEDIPYRVKYTYCSDKKNDEEAHWHGTIRHDPIEKEEIVIAGFTGNHNIAHPGLSWTDKDFNFNFKGIWYPHKDIIKNVSYHKPDILFFSGDQVYEGNSPTYADNKNYELDYLYKWYLYCLAYRNLTKDIPTISIPDDHDVYQGNIWGQGGRPIDTDNKGGYVHPAWFVKMVERTQCSNLPDPYDPTPIDQNIGVYYTSLNYGGIGFAVLEDRKFKSGCADNPFITTGRPDHVIDPKFDVRKIDLPGKKLLGNRQLDFLNDWVTDWTDHEMKIALSQTIFANMATHHGSNLIRLIADLDSNGWPQSGRDKAINALRKGFVFHLAGDQHLASIVHHGIDIWGDGIYSFCVPSVANFYPRAWWPESTGRDRSEKSQQNMGKHKDGFGNFVTVYAVTNPASFTKKSTKHEPLVLHDKMPGYGIVKMNKKNRTIRMECWPRYADPSKDQQYEGWPKTINQLDNYNRKAFAYLPMIKIKNAVNPVVTVKDEKSGELVYSIRIRGTEFKPKIFRPSSYLIIVTDTENDVERKFEGVLPIQDSRKPMVVKF